ncbi:MAG: 2'-5' RNA ligase family protein [Candidatus Thermoplasmatota archaeon]|nr:2'-5' RNA ligase family protein [Candidatus Thermoplasmatota archaeon]
MEYFIAITPPKKYGEIITQFQRRWPNNALPDFVEPHITVKSQAGLNEDEYWIDSIKAICSNFAMFKLSLKGVKSFGKSVVYIGVESNKIRILHRKIVEAISPDPENSRKYYELDLYEPHLTLGAKEFGMSEAELSEMKELANNCLHDFHSFIVKSIKIYKLIENRYQKIHEIDLKQTCSDKTF